MVDIVSNLAKSIEHKIPRSNEEGFGITNINVLE